MAGTRCEFTVSIGGNPTQNFGQFPGISAIWVSDIKINVGDIPGLNDPADPGLVYAHAPIHYPGGWNWMMFNRSIRTATTWFDDGEPIGVRVRFKAHLVPPGGGPVVQNYDHTYYLFAHNKLQQLGNSTYFDPSPPGSYAYNPIAEADSNGITTAAFGALFKSFRAGSGHASHSAYPGPEAVSETKASVVNHLRESTVFSGATHGNGVALLDSESLPNPDDINFEDDVLPVVQSKLNAAKVPPFQLVVLYACGSLGGAASAFQIDDPVSDPASKGRIVLGFTNPMSFFAMAASTYDNYIQNHLGGPDKWGKDHAALVWSKISEGKFCSTAMQEATAAIRTLKPFSITGSRPNFEAIDMMHIGDVYSRVFYVCLTEAEYASRINQSLPVDIWWLETGKIFQ